MNRPYDDHWPVPEDVWGVEAMDPLAHFTWTLGLWQQLVSSLPPSRPVLLIYSPAAEKTAIRTLRVLARIARRQDCEVFFSTPAELPLLENRGTHHQTLQLVHRASRFLNVAEWLQLQKSAPSQRVIMTCALEESVTLPRLQNFHLLTVPEEEPAYCDRKAGEIVAQLVRPALSEPPRLTMLERIVLEAGNAGIALPLTLLSRYLNLPEKNVHTELAQSWLRHFIWLLPCDHDPDLRVAFRGAWLANQIAPGAAYPTLLKTLPACDFTIPAERRFFLALFTALKAHGDLLRHARLQNCLHDMLLDGYHQAAGCEGAAWGHLLDLNFPKLAQAWMLSLEGRFKLARVWWHYTRRKLHLRLVVRLTAL